ncbi:glycosyl transferase family 1 [Spirochaetia bacterium]|nr:glycosyl transferase family 1 [Spirochaetia bacterium]
MTILHIITGLGMGGAERVVLDLSTVYKKENHTVHVVSLSKSDALKRKFQEIGVEPIIFDFSKKFLDNVKQIIQLIKENEIDIVHLHLAHPIILSPFIYCFTRTKILFTSHSFDIGGRIREFYTWLLKPFRHSDILFSKTQYRYFYKSNFSVIGNGIDIERYNANCQKFDVFTFIAIGRLERVKNHRVLIGLMHKMIYVHKKGCQLLIVGDGELRSEIETEIKMADLENKIHLLGIRDDINILMAQSHCVLMPSLWEGLPIVLLEAGASKLPIISTNVGSIPTLLDEENSYSCPLENFEKNMVFVMNNYKEACNKAMILYRKIVDHYSLRSIGREHINLYSSLLKS